MNDSFTIFVVDSDKIAQMILLETLGKSYPVTGFDSGADCLAALSNQTPELFILDIEMSGMDGYELCRQIKALPLCNNVPVIFISARDDLDSRVKGFDAGGHDFIVKPCVAAELQQKVELIERASVERSELLRRVDESEMLSSLIMSNLDEYAALIKFLRDLNSCEEYQDIAKQLFGLFKAYRLEGAVQIRMPGKELTLDHLGEANPLEVSIFGHVSTMGRIVQFKNRAAYNYKSISLLINNVPLEDPELCGRLRDHLAIAAETVDAKLQAIIDRQDIAHTKSDISNLIDLLGHMLAQFKENYSQARYHGLITTEKIIRNLNATIVGLAMTDGQEESLREIILEGAEALARCYDFGKETENTFSELVERLTKTLTLVERQNN